MGESDGKVSIDIKVIDGTLRRELTIYLSTYDQTASGKLTSDVDNDNLISLWQQMYTLTANVDYVSRTDYALTFDQDKNCYTVNITIHNEGLDEEDEVFTMSLSFPGIDYQRVLLEPRNATVEIIDVIGEGKEVLINFVQSYWEYMTLFIWNMKLDLPHLNSMQVRVKAM